MQQPTVVEAARDLSHLLSVRSCRAPCFSHDGQRAFFLYDESGVPEVWSVSIDGGWPERHSFAGERVSRIACDPATPRQVFVADAGGSEDSQLYLLESAGATQTWLGPGPDSIASFGAFSADGARIAYSTNQRDPRAFDVQVRTLGPRGAGEARTVVGGGGLWYAEAFHPDGDHLLVRLALDNVTDELHLVRLSDGTRRALAPRAGRARGRHHSASFSADGRCIFLLSDADDDFQRLCRLSLETGERRALDPGGWDVELACASADRLCFARNVRGRSELWTCDSRGEALARTLHVPCGVIHELSLAPDGRRAAFSLSGDRNPADVFVVDLPAGSPRAVTSASRAGVQANCLVESSEETFQSFDGLRIPVWTYRPSGVDGAACVVMVHGGPESQYRPEFNPLAQFLVARGHAVCAPNVRGSRGYGNAFMALDDVRRRPDAVRDLDECARWLGGRRGIDGTRLAVMGRSYGGFMVLASLTRHPERWAAGVDVVGISNWITFLEHTKPWRRPLREREYGTLERDREFLKSLSPLHGVDRIRAPLMVVHGRNDPRVPVGEARQVVSALRRRQRDVEYLEYSDEGHGIVKLANQLTCYRAVADFLDRCLSRPGL